MKNNFKFLKNNLQPTNNMYLCYHMDEVLIHVLRYKQINNMDILNHDTPFQFVNVPINGWMRINNWRSYDLNVPHMIEIDYSVIEVNTQSRDYTCRMETSELLRRIHITGI